VRCCKKKFTFAISSPDEFLYSFLSVCAALSVDELCPTRRCDVTWCCRFLTDARMRHVRRSVHVLQRLGRQLWNDRSNTQVRTHLCLGTQRQRAARSVLYRRLDRTVVLNVQVQLHVYVAIHYSEYLYTSTRYSISRSCPGPL